jgi:glycosyltransferase involved in cell wall biosynthesis
MQPLVSILIPAYNAERWLAETLECAVNQTWSRKEIIVVDDGSTDATLSVAKRFDSPLVRVISKAHSGKAGTVNLALKESQGDYLQYLDADDLLAPDKVQVQIERLTVASPNAIATCAWARFYGNDLGTAVFRPQPDFRDYDAPIDWLIESWGGRGTMPPVAWLLPRPVVDRAGAWHEGLSLSDDTEYFTRIVLNADRIVFCGNVHGYYRSGNLSLSGTRSPAAIESFYEVCKLSAQHLLHFEDSPRTRHACANLWQHFAHWVYPDAPDLVHRAEANAQSFGGARLKLQGSLAFQIAREVLGWKAARRLQMARPRLASTSRTRASSLSD